MARKLIIDGNAVYELDENCRLQKAQKAEQERQEENKQLENKNSTGQRKRYS